MPDTSPRTETFTVVLPATAAGSDFEAAICKAPFAGELTAAAYLADTAITGANTDSRTIQIINKALDGNGTTVMASLALLSGTNAADFDETALTLSEVEDATVVAAGDVIAAKSLHVGGTGLADPGGTVLITLSRT